MTAWMLATLIVVIGVVAPSLLICSREDPVARLLGLEVLGASVVLAMLLFAQAVNSPSYLIVPLVLAVLSVAGTLVFTRLLGPRP